MFWKTKNNIDHTNAQWYVDALQAIKLFMASRDWEKTYQAIEEIKTKETQAYSVLSTKLAKDSHDINNSVQQKQKKLFDKKILELEKLKQSAQQQEKKYTKIDDDARFKLRFKKIKKELILLSKTHKHDLALNLLSVFLEENKDKALVVDFYNKEKKHILWEKEKSQKTEAEKIKKNARLEALKLIWATTHLELSENKTEKKSDKQKKNRGLWWSLKNKFNFYKKVRDNLEKKKLMNEINLLIDEDSKIKTDLAAKKLASMHKGLIKEIKNENILGYELYGKILGADKITGDTFGFHEAKDKYNFFIWDATWHGIRAWFIVALISRLFTKNITSKTLKQSSFEINNGLKQDLKSRNFITAIFFELFKNNLNNIKFVGMWHEPMFVYRKKTGKIEKIIPGWLAAGIRMIKHIEDISEKTIEMWDGDILITYSDGAIEMKSMTGEFYWIDRFIKTIEEIAHVESDIEKIYEYITNDFKWFRWGMNFDDDMTLLLLKRETKKDIIHAKDLYLEKISIKEWLNRREAQTLVWKNKHEIEQELDKIRKKKELEGIVKNLEQLYLIWEILKLKQEAIRFIKAGFIDKRINALLKKAINNETKYKIEQKETKIKSKYHVMEELMKKWDYQTVINTCEDIIAKDGSI